MQSTTPDGTPPQDFIPLNPQPMGQTAPTPDTSAILANLQALANMAKQNPTAAVAAGSSTQGSSNNVTFPQNLFPQNMPSSVNPATSLPPPVQAVNVPGAVNGVFSYPGMNATSNFLQSLPNGQPNMQAVPPPIMPQGNLSVPPEALQQQLQILQALRAQGVPPDQWAAVLSVLTANAPSSAPVANPPSFAAGAFGAKDDQSRDRNGHEQYMRSPPDRYRRRSRSPPSYDRGRESPPRRRNSPVYGEYGNDRNGRGGDYSRHGGTRGRGNAYRQRSPDRFRRSPSPRRQEQELPVPGPKWIEYDRSIGEGMIKGEDRAPSLTVVPHICLRLLKYSAEPSLWVV